MPSTIVKLGAAHARAWAYNQPVWVGEDGSVKRAVTRDEQHAISRTLEKTRGVEQSFRTVVPLVAPPIGRRGARSNSVQHRMQQQQQGAVPGSSLELAVQIEWFGKDRHVTIYKGRLRYATGREVLSAELLAEYGECVLHGRNGKLISVLRDPLAGQRPPNLGKRVQFSKSPEERALVQAHREGRVPSGRRGPVLQERSAGPSARPARTAKVFSPRECPNDCRGLRGGDGWALSKNAQPPGPNEHHPVCQYAKSWAATLIDEESELVLYDLELAVIARPAERDEIDQADGNASRGGLRTVIVSDRNYAVLTRAEAEQAAREARGDGEHDAEAPEEIEGEPVDALGVPGQGAAALEAATHPASAQPFTPGPEEETPPEHGRWPLLPAHGALVRGPGGSVTAPVARAVSARDYLARPAPRDADEGLAGAGG